MIIIKRNRSIISFVFVIFAVSLLTLVSLLTSCENFNKKPSSFSSAYVYSEIIATMEESSEIVVSEESSSSSSSTVSVSSSVSVTSYTATSSVAPVVSQSVAVSNFNVYAEAEKWTYVVDKSKPVPLQPKVSNDFFKDAMFVGDSITTGLDLYSIINNAPVIAYTGINTSTVLTRNVIRSGGSKITFLQAMKKYNPKHIYIMMGINGIAFQSLQEMITGYSNFISAVKKQHPNAVIYLQSILPVTNKKQNSDKRFANSKIDMYNSAIAELAKRKDVYYLNVAEAFKDSNGNLPAKASSDGIHFGPAHYRLWIEYLKRHTVYTGVIPVESSSSVEQTTPVTPPQTPTTTTPATPQPPPETTTTSAAPATPPTPPTEENNTDVVNSLNIPTTE